EPLAREQMTCSDDGPFHLYRAVQLGALLEAGHWFPRWAPHMAQGYGFPFFNFYAPLSSYFVVLLHRLGLEYPAALKVAFALAIWLAGCAAFLSARTHWGERAGLVAGVAYLFAPYLAYDVLFRANFAETLAFVWPPLILWALQKLAEAGERMNRRLPSFLLLPFCYTALILTHNIFALIASPLFAGYLAMQAWQRRSWAVLIQGGLALALGIGLTTYFWLPALAERGLVHSDRLLVPPIFTWYTNFITAGELLGWPRAADPLLINPSPARMIGPVILLFGLPALIGLAWRARRGDWRLEIRD
ncbi:MAG: 6-pyruvoyl-tetrahydropterin synthase-related protein, partial [Anaerolineales bacterium]|nr:6-pyruvoyl-tetrahydropterin synthase-related protein [Anaerolineales bacterium]